VVVRTITPYIL